MGVEGYMSIEIPVIYLLYAFVVFIHLVMVSIIISSWDINHDNAKFGEITRTGTIQISIVILGLLWLAIAYLSGVIVVVH